MATDIEPGSWRVVESESAHMGMRRVEVWHHGLPIASLNMRHLPSAREDGRRMAAAPDLVAALRLFRFEFGSYDSHCGFISKMTAMADAAIAKYDGEIP